MLLRTVVIPFVLSLRVSFCVRERMLFLSRQRKKPGFLVIFCKKITLECFEVLWESRPEIFCFFVNLVVFSVALFEIVVGFFVHLLFFY